MRPAVPLLALAIALTAAAPVRAQRTLAIRDFQATIVVNPDGSIDVTEAITAEFKGAWNGIYRTIPVEYRTPQGFNWTLKLDFLGATSGPESAPLKVERSRERHYMKYKIWVPGAEDATHTVQLHYRAENGLRFFEDHDELYWNITGDEWDVPMDSVRAEIRLPAGAAGVRAIAFNGFYGSTAQEAEVETDGTVIRITMPRGLEFHEGVTAVVGWNKGLVREPTRAERALGFVGSNWPVGLPFVVLLAMFNIWRRRGKDPEELPVSVQYEPPAGLTPAEAGTLVDEVVDMRDVTATMIDLGVKGHLSIEERETKILFLFKNKEYVFHRLEPAAGAPALEPHERLVLEGIFESGKREVKLSELDEEFYTHLGGIRTAVYNRLVERKLYLTRPDHVKARWTAGGLALGVGFVFLGAIAGPRFGLTPAPFVLGGFAGGLIMVLFARVMPARTVKGARALEKVRGFEEFMSRVEGERLERIKKAPELFERYLPYAMALKVEKRWARAFEGIYREPPRWYVGSDPIGFSATNFTGRLSELSTSAASTMSSSPRSSSGSGFGGGGSSGGGGGGGGGGGF